MAAGYTRQATANIAAGLAIQSADLNAEYNQIQSAFDGTTGHDHTGGSGLGPKITLTTSVSGILPIANGGSGSSSFTAGSVLFSNGTIITQDNTKLFWDNANDRLGLGTAAPVSNLQIHTASAASTRVHLTNSTTGASTTDGLLLQEDASGAAYVWNYENQPLIFATNNTERGRFNAVGGLNITGAVDITTVYRINGINLAAGHLSNGVTGTGAVMLAASPTTTGVLTAATITASGDLGVTGTATLANVVLGADLAIADGGTAASTALGAFANLVVTASSIANPGYMQLKNGLILQWGATAVVGVNTIPISFPASFTSALFTVLTNIQLAAGGTQDVGTASETTTGFTANFSSAYTGQLFWFAVGV